MCKPKSELKQFQVAVGTQYVDRRLIDGAPDDADPMAVMFLSCTIDREGTQIRGIAEIILVTAKVPDGGTEMDYTLGVNWVADPEHPPTPGEAAAMDLAVEDTIKRQMGGDYQTGAQFDGKTPVGVVLSRT